MKNVAVAFLAILLSATGQGQDTLSEKAHISLITCGPWQGEVYAAFGHSAYRVYDPVQHLDLAFNYGVFDFDQPHFYLNFARGFLYYKLAIYRYPDFRDAYVADNRSIHEQELNLSARQKQELFSYLVWNALPENQYYRYDYYFNNCATKMRDVIQAALESQVVFDPTFITSHDSFRDLTHRYLGAQPWGELGIDICLGIQIDREANPYEYMFLPDYVEASFDHALIISPQGLGIPLVKEKRVVYDPGPESNAFHWSHPRYVFSLILAICLFFSFRDLRKGKPSKWLDYVMLAASGLTGTLLVFLWTSTDHWSVGNYNLLWALPANLVAVFIFIRRPRWLRFYFLAAAMIAAGTLLFWSLIPQDLNNMLIPLVIALTVRYGVNYYLGRT